MDKLTDIIAGIGFMGFLFFGSALDGPGNDMRLVYGGLLISMALMGIGGLMYKKFEQEKS